MSLFSICIPNYNYQNYIGETLQSVLDQECKDLEIVIADNASTDSSVEVINTFQTRDPRIHLQVNRCNVGFSGNLQKSAAMASGQWRTLLSSDDLLHPSCLNIYKQLIEWYGEEANTVILSSAQDVIDGKGIKYNYIGVDWKLWSGAIKHDELSVLVKADVWIIEAAALLKNSLLYMRTPFAFASTTYSTHLFQKVEGYSQGGLYNPDKKFAWAILGHARYAIFVDKPLVAYRVHNQNQESQQNKSGALKRLTDQYISTFQLEAYVLEKAGLSRVTFEKAFIEQDIVLRGLYALADGDRIAAKRMVWFAKATYRSHLVQNKKYWALAVLLNLGYLGVWIARKARTVYLVNWQK